MRVQFDYSEEEFVEGQLRFLSRSNVVRSWHWRGYFTAAIVWGLLGFAFFPWLGRGALGVVAILTVLGVVLYPTFYQAEVEKRVRKLCREKITQGCPLSCEVELSPIGVEIRQKGSQVTHEWEQVAEVKQTVDSVDIFTRMGGGVIVRQRAFASPAEQQQFVNLAHSYLALARHDERDKAPAISSGDDLMLK